MAIVVLATLLLYLATGDGGFDLPSWHLAGIVALSLPPALRELRRARTSVQAVVAVWALGAVTALVFAADRADFVQVTLVYALMPMTALTAAGLLRRPWGRIAVLGLLVASFTLYWQRSFMQWWGYTLSDLDTRWLPLSWHNQSATLMAAFGVFFLGVTVTTKRAVATGTGIVAAMGLAGVWLAGSRGALVAGALGLLVAVSLGGRWQGWRRTVVATGVVVLAAISTASGLLAMDDAAERITSEQSATSNLVARLYHMEAAVGMFLDRPLTGHGLGSYATSARPYTSPEANLTVSPHNELIQPFAEGGLVFGLPVLAGGGLVGWLVLRALLHSAPRARRGQNVRAQLEAATVAGAASAAVVLLSHALVDFDWRYPVLAALLAIVTALAWSPDRDGESRPASADKPSVPSRRPWLRTGFAGIGMIAITALLAAGVWGAWTQRATSQADGSMSASEHAVAHPVWDAQSNARAAIGLLRGGEVTAAAMTVERTRPWNPGRADLQALQRIVEVEQRRRAPQALIDALPPYPTRFALRNLGAELLIRRGEYELAQELMAESLAVHRKFQKWGVARTVAHTWELRIALAAHTGGCTRAQQLAARAGAEPILASNDNASSHFRAHANTLCDGGAT